MCACIFSSKKRYLRSVREITQRFFSKMYYLGFSAPVSVPLSVFSNVIKIYVRLWALGAADRQLRCQQSVSCQRQMLNVRWCPRQCWALLLATTPETGADYKLNSFQTHKSWLFDLGCCLFFKRWRMKGLCQDGQLCLIPTPCPMEPSAGSFVRHAVR